MRYIGVVGVALVTTLLVGIGAPSAVADPQEAALNGVFTVVSNGQMAKTNERFQDEATVTGTWAIAMQCGSFLDCAGTVSSDKGWTANIAYQSNVWKVIRHLDGWEPCPDGTSAPGTQIYLFWVDPDVPGRYTGFDTTTGPSGACGINRPLVIELPLTVTPV